MEQFFKGQDLLSDDAPPLVDPIPEEVGELAVDVYQKDDHVVVKAPMAGVDPKDLELSVTKEAVTMRGTRHQEHEAKDNDYFVKECYWGAFERTVALPVPVESGKARAHYKQGLLTITIPKASETTAKKIDIVTE